MSSKFSRVVNMVLFTPVEVNNLAEVIFRDVLTEIV